MLRFRKVESIPHRISSRMLMIDTSYLHLSFKGRHGEWSINLPFLCTRCGVCCTLDDFLTAGEITVKPNEHPEIHAKMKAVSEELGKIWEASETKYDQYITRNPCPFLSNRICTIYEIRPDGCRLFPNTKFGMLTEDCEALTRFRKQRAALKKGRACKETYHSTGRGEPIKPSNATEKQHQACIAKLRQVGVTDEEVALFHALNGSN